MRMMTAARSQVSAAVIFGELSELAYRFPAMAQTAGPFSFQGWRGFMAEHENGAPSVSIRIFFAADSALAA